VYDLAKVRRLGYTEDEVAHGGGERLVDDLVYWGDAGAFADKLHGHVRAGADHVAVQVIGIGPGGSASRTGGGPRTPFRYGALPGDRADSRRVTG
jgi:hypothetical protein